MSSVGSNLKDLCSKCLIYARQRSGVVDKNMNKIIRYTTLVDLKD